MTATYPRDTIYRRLRRIEETLTPEALCEKIYSPAVAVHVWCAVMEGNYRWIYLPGDELHVVVDVPEDLPVDTSEKNPGVVVLRHVSWMESVQVGV